VLSTSLRMIDDILSKQDCMIVYIDTECLHSVVIENIMLMLVDGFACMSYNCGVGLERYVESLSGNGSLDIVSRRYHVIKGHINPCD
jgi:hypothetical protein